MISSDGISKKFYSDTSSCLYSIHDMIASRAFDARHIDVDILEKQIYTYVRINERVSTPCCLSFVAGVNLTRLFVSPPSKRKIDFDKYRVLFIPFSSGFTNLNSITIRVLHYHYFLSNI